MILNMKVINLIEMMNKKIHFQNLSLSTLSMVLGDLSLVMAILIEIIHALHLSRDRCYVATVPLFLMLLKIATSFWLVVRQTSIACCKAKHKQYSIQITAQYIKCGVLRFQVSRFISGHRFDHVVVDVTCYRCCQGIRYCGRR